MTDGASRIGRAAAATRAAAVLSLGVLAGTGACASGSDGNAAGTRDTARTAEVDTVSQRSIIEVQEAHADAWEALDGVVGTGVGRCDGEPCIKVFVRERTPALEEEIPSRVEGYPVRLEITGPFRSRDTAGSPGGD